MKNKPKVSICIPTYNAQNIILPTLKNILSQSYPNLEIIISDDCSTDRTIKTIRSLKSPLIKIHQNKSNVGYARNLNNFITLASGDIIYLMGQDDFIINNGLQKTIDQFIKQPNLGAVTRPYYWYSDEINRPIRHIPPPSETDKYINILKNPEMLVPIIESIGQLSGLAFQKKYLASFNPHTFTAHVEPFLQIIKTHGVVFLSDYTIAVQIKTSQTRFVSKIYEISPTKTWMEMLSKVFKDRKYKQQLILSQNHMAQNYIGLIQLKNYSTYRILIKEIIFLLLYRPLNFLSCKFYLYSLLTLIVPSRLLIRLTDYFKEKINSKTLPEITININ
ncbi:MAG: glycosyltransferase family 2 protein [Patescibacteria group bacterium]|jgi:glycosyltransferase involved in cell wall biosynthesis